MKEKSNIDVNTSLGEGAKSQSIRHRIVNASNISSDRLDSVLSHQTKMSQEGISSNTDIGSNARVEGSVAHEISNITIDNRAIKTISRTEEKKPSEEQIFKTHDNPIISTITLHERASAQAVTVNQHCTIIKNSPCLLKEKDTSKIEAFRCFDFIKESLKIYSLDHDKLIYRAILSLPQFSIDEGCFINLAIINKELQIKKEKKKLKIDLNDKSKIYHNYESIFNTHKKHVLIAPSDLFNSQNGQFPKRLLINGRAGIGKSTLTQFFSYQWSKGNLWEDQFDLIFKIKLRNLTTDNYSNRKIFLSDIIAKECFSNLKNWKNPMVSLTESRANILNDKTKNILIIL